MTPLGDVAALADSYDLVVIGAGPAGMAAATLAAAKGASTLLVDENPAPGGQIYRGITNTPLQVKAVLGADYWRGEAIATAFRDSDAAYLPSATVWQAAQGFELGISAHGKTRLIHARRVIGATGALERPFPIPGWTLPGVMTAGAAQTLLKASGIAMEGRVVLAGSGPLLWLIAAQYLAAGSRIDTILDTTPRGNWRNALGGLSGFATSPYLRKGLGLLMKVRRSVRVVSGVTALAAEGDARLEAVRYTSGGRETVLPVDHLLLHQGVVPNVNLASSMGCEILWDDVQAAFRPRVDGFGETSVEGFAIAGDGAGIAGAEAAAERGRLAALGALAALGLSLAAALLSYHPSDPSMNSATDAAPLNLLGRPGAWFADLVLQGFGLAAILPIPIFLAWGVRLIVARPIRHPRRSALLTLAAMLIGSAALGLAWPAPIGPLDAGAGGVAAEAESAESEE